MKRNLPLNYNRTMRKNISCNNYYSKEGNGKIIFKIRERLFSPKTLSLLSKNNYVFDRNFLKNPTPNSLSLYQLKNYRFKSFDNQAYVNYIPKKKTVIKSYSIIEENDYFEKRRRQGGPSVLYLRDIKLGDMPTLPKTKNIEEDNKRLLLINQIIKFNLSKKKEENKRNILPMQLGKEYQDYIERKNKIFFNPNYNSPFVHNMNANFMIKSNLRKYKYVYQNVKMKYQLKKLKQKEEEELMKLELRDQMEEISVDLQHYKKAIKIFLTDETKLNQIIIHEDFFDSLENKINFLYDDRKFPTIKNNLKKIKLEIIGVGGLEWDLLNMIEISTLTYLHKLKAKIQRELDEIEEENKEKQFKINQQIGIYDINNNKKRRKKSKI
jgi:hypothetical protein